MDTWGSRRYSTSLSICVLGSLVLGTSGAGCIHSYTDEAGKTYVYNLNRMISPTTYVFRAKLGSYHYRYHGQQYDYLINVCDDVHPDKLHESCEKLDASPAYQVEAPPAPPTVTTSSKASTPLKEPKDLACYRIADSGSTTFDLLNASSPEQGVKVLYKGGSKCRKRNTPEMIKKTNETWISADRVVEIRLTCDREMSLEPSTTSLINSGASIQVEEKPPPDECHYVVTWRTPYACPGNYAAGDDCPLGLCSDAASQSPSVTWVLILEYICMLLVVVGLLFVVFMAVMETKNSQQGRQVDTGYGGNGYGSNANMAMGSPMSPHSPYGNVYGGDDKKGW